MGGAESALSVRRRSYEETVQLSDGQREFICAPCGPSDKQMLLDGFEHPVA